MISVAGSSWLRERTGVLPYSRSHNTVPIAAERLHSNFAVEINGSLAVKSLTNSPVE